MLQEQWAICKWALDPCHIEHPEMVHVLLLPMIIMSVRMIAVIITTMIAAMIVMNNYNGRITGDSKRIAGSSAVLRCIVTHRSTIMGKLNAIK